MGDVVEKPAIILALGRVPASRHRSALLAARGYSVREVFSAPQLFEIVRHVDTVLVGLASSLDPASNGLDLVRRLQQTVPRVGIILIVTVSSETLVLEAFRAGVADYLREPCSDAEFIDCVDRAIRRLSSSAGIGDTYDSAPGSHPIIGESRVIRELRAYVDRVARSDCTVLITGETGVGKELVAELIHSLGARRQRPCAAINCAAIPESLLETELFGCERGAFTGADAGREGILKSAEGGSVFLDEIGEMGLSAQAKILRAIEAKEIRRVGGWRRVPLNVRLIAATNQELERLVAEGKFRRDLFYRLNVARIHLPPLREHKEDLAPLIDYYLQHFNRQFGRAVEGFTPDALEHLLRYGWPGNVRELKNLLEAIFVNLNGRQITFVDLPDHFRQRLGDTQALSRDERERLLSALFSTNWNKSRAAQELQWSRMTLYRKMAKYQVVESAATKRKMD